MSLGDALIDLAESGRVPDALIRVGIRHLVRQRLREERRHPSAQAVLETLRAGPIAPSPGQANTQHYEVPTAFFRAVLGPRLKYSACYWPPGADLAAAETATLEMYAERAGIEDGMRILDLGCGWGAFALWAAQRLPSSSVLAVSNSATQREYICSEAQRLGLGNLAAQTINVDDWQPEGRFDRIVSVEMFEHLRNYEALLRRIAGWLDSDGRLFVHIFCHGDLLYAFHSHGANNWMGREFFADGLMPAKDTLAGFQNDLRLVRQWTLGGEHYQYTARAWLDRLDAEPDAARRALLASAGAGRQDADRQIQRWRMFFMACEELFGFRGGREWHLGHYLFAPKGGP